jgi:hypothetical protein
MRYLTSRAGATVGVNRGRSFRRTWTILLSASGVGPPISTHATGKRLLGEGNVGAHRQRCCPDDCTKHRRQKTTRMSRPTREAPLRGRTGNTARPVFRIDVPRRISPTASRSTTNRRRVGIMLIDFDPLHLGIQPMIHCGHQPA